MVDNFGEFVALTVLLGSLYEVIALNSSLPTISRVVQGWRDQGGFRAVLALTILCVIALGIFGNWLVHHFLFERRTKS